MTIPSINIFKKNCTFVIGAAKEADLPATDIPEFAFAGRSNVGKSSLVNALVNRNSLVKTSKTPGRTQQINYFCLDEKIYLVDLPGYGYAKVSKSKVASWTKLINGYLRRRVQLRRVFMLVDSRHGLKPVDLQTMSMLDAAAVSYQVVLTKIDKIKQDERDKRIAELTEAMKKRPAAFPEIIMTSSEKNLGLDDVRESICSLSGR